MDNVKNQSIIDFYAITNRLKNEVRAGLLVWGVSAPRLESAAEHVYSTQMLAIAFASEHDFDIDLRRVIMMLAVHELGEAVVGDITPLDGAMRSRKRQMEIDAVQGILSGLSNGGDVRNLFMEYEDNETEEARFCHQVDKLEACLQALTYDAEGHTDFLRGKTDKTEELRQKNIQQGYVALGTAWTNQDIEWGRYDGKFLEFAKYIRDNKIFEGNK